MGLTGSAAAKLVEHEKPFWQSEHNLGIDPSLCAKQQQQISGLGKALKLCYVKVSVFDVTFEHWYITDGHYIVEFGDASLKDRCLKICASVPRIDQRVAMEFEFNGEVRRRLHNVCGATNFSLALRNSEHLAKFIHTGSWISLQMVGDSCLYKAVEKHLGAQAKLVNTPPAELKSPSRATSDTPIYPDFQNVFNVRFTRKREILDESNDAVNVVVLGPTGAGKSSIINTLFNRKVAEVKATPMSVTKHMDVYSGSFVSWFGKPYSLNVIDSIGFCDSVIPPQQVLDLVKGYIKANVFQIHKVIIVCASRIEMDQAKAINNFMTWLDYRRHKSEFIFLYNKAEDLDEDERSEAVAAMCNLLHADPTYRVCYPRDGEGEWLVVNFAFALGFRPRAHLADVKSDLDALHYAVLLFRQDQKPIQVSAANCSIL